MDKNYDRNRQGLSDGRKVVVEPRTSCQLTTQPPDLLFGQTGLGHSPSIMSSFTVVVQAKQPMFRW